MKKLLLPIILLFVGVGSGIGAGLFLTPPVEEETAMVDGTCPEPGEDHTTKVDSALPEVPKAPDPDAPANEFAKLNNQFIVPIVEDGKVNAMVVLSISLEVPAGGIQRAFSAEPKIRDQFLQVLFDHANTGGFAGNFTSANTMRVLRESLLYSAKQTLNDGVIDVLISDIIRQDV